jgi:hypothetical protein
MADVPFLSVADTFLRIIPSDPSCVPSVLARERAMNVLRRAVPQADEVSAQVSQDVRFVDCGSNFESVRCPACGTDLGEWWAEAMEMGQQQQFRDLRITTPCCGLHTSLNDLLYSWPAGFARYTLEALNPGRRSLPPRIVDRLTHVLETDLRLIWAHY